MGAYARGRADQRVRDAEIARGFDKPIVVKPHSDWSDGRNVGHMQAAEAIAKAIEEGDQ